MEQLPYFQRFGDPANDTLVLLHSGGMAGVEWKPQIESLQQHFNLYIPDMPGHGRSVLTPGSELSISLMAEAIVALLASEGVDKAHICGSSMGGSVALYIALHYPDIVDKLIVYRIGYTKNEDTYQQTVAMANPEYWRQYGMHRWLSGLHKYQGGDDAWETVIANVSKVLHPETSQHNHQLSDLARITIPTLLIAGDRDPLIPLATVMAMHDVLPDSAVWVIPQAGHITATNTWRAQAFADEIQRFCR